MGPWLVSADAFDPQAPLTVTTRVNGEVRQHDSTANLMFPFAELIRYISIWTTLKPGDVLSLIHISILISDNLLMEPILKIDQDAR